MKTRFSVTVLAVLVFTLLCAQAAGEDDSTVDPSSVKRNDQGAVSNPASSEQDVAVGKSDSIIDQSVTEKPSSGSDVVAAVEKPSSGSDVVAAAEKPVHRILRTLEDASQASQKSSEETSSKASSNAKPASDASDKASASQETRSPETVAIEGAVIDARSETTHPEPPTTAVTPEVTAKVQTQEDSSQAVPEATHQQEDSKPGSSVDSQQQGSTVQREPEAEETIPKPPPLLTPAANREADSADSPVAPNLIPSSPEAPEVAVDVGDDEKPTARHAAANPEAGPNTPVDESLYKFTEASLSFEMKLFEGVVYGVAAFVVITLFYRGLDAAGFDKAFFLKFVDGSSKGALLGRGIIHVASFTGWAVSSVMMLIFNGLVCCFKKKGSNFVSAPVPSHTSAGNHGDTSSNHHAHSGMKLGGSNAAAKKPQGATKASNNSTSTTKAQKDGWGDDWSDDNGDANGRRR